MKTGQWITYKGENWNVYKILTSSVLLHPETDDGISNGAIIEVLFNEL